MNQLEGRPLVVRVFAEVLKQLRSERLVQAEIRWRSWYAATCVHQMLIEDKPGDAP